MNKLKNISRLTFLLLSLAIASAGAAQANSEEKEDEKKEKKKTEKVDQEKKDQQKNDEMVLGEINIEAVVEKPNVDIIPKRQKPILGELMKLDRSFAKEIKSLPKEFFLFDEELDAPKKLGKIEMALKLAKEEKSSHKKKKKEKK